MNPQVSKIISQLGLCKHIEGGYFKETYRSEEMIGEKSLPKRFKGPRCFSTAIYFLLPGNEVSVFHKIKSDECWHFYFGSPLTLATIDRQGHLKRTILGPNLKRKQVFQTVVKAGIWMGAYCQNKKSFTLVGCTSAPGFEFEDFELAKRKELLVSYPQHTDIIKQLTAR